MSLDAVEVDVSDVFAMGQTYVALSRCTALEGLYLSKPIEPKHCKANSSVVAFLGKLSSSSPASGTPTFVALNGFVFVFEGQFKTHSKKSLAKMVRNAGARQGRKESKKEILFVLNLSFHSNKELLLLLTATPLSLTPSLGRPKQISQSSAGPKTWLSGPRKR